VNNTLKVSLGTFARSGVEANLGPDVPAGVRLALADYVRRIDSGAHPVGPPKFDLDGLGAASAASFELPVDAHTLAVLKREAMREGASVGAIAAHSVLLYLAELDRLSPPNATRAA
jgi:hypothetical protein